MSQLASHNKFRHKLFRDSSIIIIVTFAVLILSGICGIAIVDILRNQHGYQYEASSFGKSKCQNFNFTSVLKLALFFQKLLTVTNFCQ